jgi:hypothetical protein
MNIETRPAHFNNETIVDGYDLVFDTGDKLNGSLYLCTPRGGDAADALRILELLRAAGLWSDAPGKSVANDQRQAYKNGLEFVEAQAFRTDGGHVVVARFDHPKYPSDAGRWRAWLDCIGTAYERLG